MQLTMKLETITPAMAKEYMTRNLNNRNFQKGVSNLYARLMKEGQWMVNGDAIRFNINGDMVDGQHRLQAVVDSGIPLSTFVIRGLPVEAQLTIDQQKKRTAGDMLAMRGIPNGNQIAAIVRMVKRWDAGERNMYGFSGNALMLSAKEVVTEIEAHPIYTEAGRRAGVAGLRTLATTRVTGTMFVLFERASVSHCEAFFDSLSKGSDLSEGSPILTLRRYWINLSRNRRKYNTPVYLMAGVRAWNAYVEGRTLGGVAYKSGLIPEITVPKQELDNGGSEPQFEPEIEVEPEVEMEFETEPQPEPQPMLEPEQEPASELQPEFDPEPQYVPSPRRKTSSQQAV